MNLYIQGLGGLNLYFYDKKWIRVDRYEENNNNSTSPYHYHTAFSSFTHDEKSFFKKPTILDYDLRKSPRDICFQIMTNGGYAKIDGIWSNVVRIPKEMLIKLFAEHPRRVPPPN